MTIRSRSSFVLTLGVVGFVLQWLVLGSPVSANIWSGPAIATSEGGWTFVPAESIQAWIEQAIEANQAQAPPGNPGPFTPGYHSIVILSGQCYSQGLYSMFNGYPNVLIGAAASSTKEAKWHSDELADTTRAKWLWLSRLAEEIRTNPNRPIKTILEVVANANPDPPAETPAPVHTPGGEGVVLGNPQNETGRSYHAVIYAGKLSERNSPEKESEDAATRRAIRETREALENDTHVPPENIRTVNAPATWDSLKNAIKETWQHMNNNEQFILVLANHSNYVQEKKANVMFPGPGPNQQQTEVPTDDFSVSPGVIQPEFMFETAFVLSPAVVRLNGVVIGALAPSPGPAWQTLAFSPGLLAPAGQMNTVIVGATLANVSVTRIGLSTGPVAGMSIGPVVPGLGGALTSVLVLLCLSAGWMMIRRRTATPG